MTDSDADTKEDYDCPSCNRSFSTRSGLGVHHSATHGGKIGVEIECEECEDTFKVPHCRKDSAKYCSAECRDAYDTIECKNCGTEFDVRPSRNHRKFCSKDCFWSWNTGDNHPNTVEKVDVECFNCGESMSIPPWKDDKSNRKFCDEDCRGEWLTEWLQGRYTGEDHWMHDIDPEDHPMYIGGSAPYGPGWDDKKKRAVRERDGFECMVCGMAQQEHRDRYGCALHVHHIVKARKFDDPEKRNAMDNLITMCIGCHRQYEGVPIDAT